MHSGALSVGDAGRGSGSFLEKKASWCGGLCGSTPRRHDGDPAHRSSHSQKPAGGLDYPRMNGDRVLVVIFEAENDHRSTVAASGRAGSGGGGVRYVKVVWEHDHADEPVLFLSELGEDDYETRKVQTYRDGRSEWADAEHESDAAFLTEVPFPSVEEISEQPECSAEAITAEEFERAWRRSRAGS